MSMAVTRKNPLPPVAKKPDDGIPRKKGWATPYGFADFRDPVTYEEACAEMKPFWDRFQQQIGKKP